MKFITFLLVVTLLASIVVSALLPTSEYIYSVYGAGIASAMGLQAIIFNKLVKRDEVVQANA